jgi:hypothetical protein
MHLICNTKALKNYKEGAILVPSFVFTQTGEAQGALIFLHNSLLDLCKNKENSLPGQAGSLRVQQDCWSIKLKVYDNNKLVQTI